MPYASEFPLIVKAQAERECRKILAGYICRGLR